MENKNQTAFKLDLKDKKILFELDFNARISYTQLAKKVGLSKQGVEYRVRNLLKKGIITGFYPVIQVNQLGYIYCRLPIALHDVTKQKQEEIISYLKNHHQVFWLLSMQGIYDFLIAIWARSISEFKEFVEELEGHFGEYIRKKPEVIATDVVHFQYRFLLGKEDTKEIHLRETAQRTEIDELDKKIIAALCIDGRMPLVEIGRKVKESAKVVAYRMRRLERKKFIEGYRPILDHNKIGYTYYKVFISLNKITRQSLVAVKTYIKHNPLVIYLVENIGSPGDIDIEIMVNSNQQLSQFIEDLRFRFPTLIGEYQTVMYTDTLKVKYFPF